MFSASCLLWLLLFLLLLPGCVLLTSSLVLPQRMIRFPIFSLSRVYLSRIASAFLQEFVHSFIQQTFIEYLYQAKGEEDRHDCLPYGSYSLAEPLWRTPSLSVDSAHCSFLLPRGWGWMRGDGESLGILDYPFGFPIPTLTFVISPFLNPPHIILIWVYQVFSAGTLTDFKAAVELELRQGFSKVKFETKDGESKLGFLVHLGCYNSIP